MVWLMGGALVLALAMIAGLLLLVVVRGGATFWPSGVLRIDRATGAPLMGELDREEEYEPGPQVFAALPADLRGPAEAAVAAAGGKARRRLMRSGNYELSGTHFNWVSDFEVTGESHPEWAIVVERLAWGRFYGFPREFRVDGKVVASAPADVWERFEEFHGAARDRWQKQRNLEEHAKGDVSRRVNAARLDVRRAELDHGKDSPEVRAAKEAYARVEKETAADFARVRAQVDELKTENDRYRIVFATADGKEKALGLDEIVRAYPANRLSLWGKLGVYSSRWWEFLSGDPREANSEGGVYPAIFGTVLMTLIMSLLVVPFGVLAALYLREYAKQGFLVSVVRIAVNNLAGVPSIVFGVFGLGFFCYVIGASIDQLFFAADLPNPTFRKGGILWASLTLALLTLPVVIVATEEALAAVPNSMREGSYACGASKWQTIRRIVLPRAMPGIMTGMILAIARGAGEVAPLMLVGAVKMAEKLPVDRDFPFIHPERSFMHLGFHIYDLGFQSPNSDAAKPMVFTTTLLLIGIVVLLNIIAVRIRARLRRAHEVAA